MDDSVGHRWHCLTLYALAIRKTAHLSGTLHRLRRILFGSQGEDQQKKIISDSHKKRTGHPLPPVSSSFEAKSAPVVDIIK